MKRAVVVTGGASGIGRATVEWFLERGWAVVMADANPEAGQALSETLKGRGDLLFLKTDVSEEPQVAAAVALAVERFGRLDCMVNNAGIGGAFGPIAEIEAEDWDYTFEVLTRGVFLGTKHAARVLLRQAEGGSIINTASVGGLVSGGAPQAYSAAKAAVVMLGKSTAAELGPHRIRVNTVCPGVIVTPLIGDDGNAVASALRGVQPWPEVGRPIDVANTIGFLASDEARFITGAAIPIDGGLLATGMRLENSFGNNAGMRGLVGVNRGTTGAKSFVRRKVN